MLCLEDEVELGSDGASGFAGLRFDHDALPEVDLAAVRTESELLGKRLAAPLVVGAMTGGTARAGELNRRLERSEFMPFAPYVLEEDAQQVFEITPVNCYAARFMTTTCSVREGWRERIPDSYSLCSSVKRMKPVRLRTKAMAMAAVAT